ncbi:MAG: hypothetical protein FWE01_00730 [Firmicutes bacterium]|nr:hypothetical protein [Bacillota bacterium]
MSNIIAKRSSRARIDVIGAAIVFTLIATGFCALWVLVFVNQPPSVNSIVIAVVSMTALLLIIFWQLRLNYNKIHPDRIIIDGQKLVLVKPASRTDIKKNASKQERKENKIQKFEHIEIYLKDIMSCTYEKHTITITTQSGQEFKQDYIDGTEEVAKLVNSLFASYR